MALYAQQLLTNPTLKLFWKASALGPSGGTSRRGTRHAAEHAEGGEGEEGQQQEAPAHIRGLGTIKRRDALHGDAQIGEVRGNAVLEYACFDGAWPMPWG